MADAMTFVALSASAIRQAPPCSLCQSGSATLEYEVRTAEGTSRQTGRCCSTCACNLLLALAQVHEHAPPVGGDVVETPDLNKEQPRPCQCAPQKEAKDTRSARPPSPTRR